MREKLFLLRKRKGLTQEQIATAAGIERTAYCRIEKYNDRKPPVDVAIKIAEILGVRVEDIFMPNDVQEIHNDDDQAAALDATGTGTEGK